MAARTKAQVRTLDEVARLYRALRSAGSTGGGTLKVGGVKLAGWEFVERRPNGDLVVADAAGATHTISM